MCKNEQSIFAQFIFGIHVLPLHIETGRFNNILDVHTGLYRKMTVDERLCKICHMNFVVG